MQFGIDIETGQRIRPKRGLKAVCHCCMEEIIPKCGKFMIHHWAHKRNNCDHWWEQETEWHRLWKEQFPEEWREIVKIESTSGEKHIADIFNPANGWVIEFQNSPIDLEELQSRERFYEKMVWVVNAENTSIKLSSIQQHYEEVKSVESSLWHTSLNDAIKIPNQVFKKLIFRRDEMLKLMKPNSYYEEIVELEGLFMQEFEKVVSYFLQHMDLPDIRGVSPSEARFELLSPFISITRRWLESLIQKNNTLDDNNKYYHYIWTRRRKVWNYAKTHVFLDTGHELYWLQSNSILRKVPTKHFIANYIK